MKGLPVTLDHRRGMMAQKATERRRRRADVEDCARALREQQDALEAQLSASPSANWPEAAAKARYLLSLFSGTPIAQDPRRQRLIANVLDDFVRLTAGRNDSGADNRGKASQWPTGNSAATGKPEKNRNPRR
jgi:hypothetical protein